MANLLQDSRIYVAGHKGLVGSAVERLLRDQGYRHIIGYSSAEVDLTDQRQTYAMFEREQPEYVIQCAAKVGGIHANATYPVDFLFRNLMIQANIISEAARIGVKRLLFLGSSCIYPRECPQPVREEYLLTGMLEPSNRPYAIAKIAGIEMCSAYNRQYGTRFLSLMPTNLYGVGDNYHLENSHVIPGIMRKMHEAKVSNSDSVTLWGTGKARREFLYSTDLANAALTLMNLPDSQYNNLLQTPPLLNVGCGKDITVAELASLIANVVGFHGKIIWDTSKPDGTPRKILDISRIQQLGWKPVISLEEGLQIAYKDFLKSR